MILVITETSKVYKRIIEMPPSALTHLSLTQKTVLNPNKGLYGETINIVYVYGELRNLLHLKLGDYKGKVVIVAPINLIFAVSRFLSINQIQHSLEQPTSEELIELVKTKFTASETQAKFICNHFKNNYKYIMLNNVAITQYIKDNITLPERYIMKSTSYVDVLMYLCGDPNVSQNIYIQTLYKYRYAGKHIIKFIRRILNLYIELYFGETTDKLYSGSQEILLVEHMAEFLPIERAYQLYLNLENATCEDLLKVVI